MTDIGTTAIQVSPEVPTEDEMNKVRAILERAINAMVGMSQLTADVDMLRQSQAFRPIPNAFEPRTQA